MILRDLVTIGCLVVIAFVTVKLLLAVARVTFGIG